MPYVKDNDQSIEQRELEVIRAIYRENHGTYEERVNVIIDRAKEAQAKARDPIWWVWK